MGTVKGGKKAVTIWGLVSILVIGAWLLASITQAGAETKTLKCRLINNSTKVEVIQVGDEKGHIVGVYERKGLMFHENGEVAAEIARGRFDSIKGILSYQGYCVQTFEDGSTQWMKYQGKSKPVPGGKSRLSEATFEFIKGTGRFEGIKGGGSFTGKGIDYTKEVAGYAYFDFNGTYTLPSK